MGGRLTVFPHVLARRDAAGRLEKQRALRVVGSEAVSEHPLVLGLDVVEVPAVLVRVVLPAVAGKRAVSGVSACVGFARRHTQKEAAADSTRLFALGLARSST